MSEENNVAVEATSNMEEKQTPKKASGKSRKVIIAGCVLVSCCVLTAVFSTVAYAMFSQKDVPVLSDVVEMGENIAVSDEKQAEMVQEDMVNSVFSVLLPATKSEDTNAFFKANFTEEELKSMITEDKTFDSVRYDINLDMSMEDSGQFTVKMQGFVKKTEQDMYDFSSDFDGAFTASGMKLTAKGDIRSIGDKLFIRATELPAMAETYSELQDKWIMINMEDVDDLTGTPADDTEEEEITREDLEDIKELLESKEVGQTIKRIDGENIEGIRTNCFEIDLDKDSLEDILFKADEIFNDDAETPLTEEDLQDLSFKDLEYLKVVMCSGRKDKRLYKLTLDMKVGGDDPMTLGLDGKFWDYDKVNDKIEEPSDYMTEDELMQELMGGYMNDYPDENYFDEFDYNNDYDFQMDDNDMNWDF